MGLTCNEFESLNLTWDELDALDLSRDDWDKMTLDKINELIKSRIKRIEQLPNNSKLETKFFESFNRFVDNLNDVTDISLESIENGNFAHMKLAASTVAKEYIQKGFENVKAPSATEYASFLGQILDNAGRTANATEEMVLEIKELKQNLNTERDERELSDKMNRKIAVAALWVAIIVGVFTLGSLILEAIPYFNRC